MMLSTEQMAALNQQEIELLKQKGPPPMTRDEAIGKVFTIGKGSFSLLQATDLVDALIALDLLKVEEQKDAKTAAIQTLSTAIIGAGPGAFKLDAAYAFGIVEALERAGLTIVRKEDAK